MAEEEAATRICCGPWHSASVAVAAQAKATNNANAPANVGMCLGSKCMAWRWSKRVYPQGKVQSIDKGFCGLAGKLDQ